MRWMIPQILWTGASIAYWSGLMSPIMKLSQEKDNKQIEERVVLQNCLFAFIFFGIGQAVSGFVMGKLIDLTCSKTACIFNVIIMAVVMAFSVLNLRLLRFGWFSYLTLFLWGF